MPGSRTGVGHLTKSHRLCYNRDVGKVGWVAIGGSRVVVKQWHGRGYRQLRCFQGFARKGRDTAHCGHTHFHVKRAALCAKTLANRLNKQEAN